jgi:hypothetical protein
MFLLDLTYIDRIPIVQQVIITLPVCRGRDRMVVEFTTTHAISAVYNDYNLLNVTRAVYNDYNLLNYWYAINIR